MKDIVVIESLRKRGTGLGNMQEVLTYEAIERKPRVLDKAPKRLNFTKATDIQVYGCCSEFVITYNDLKSNISIEQATLDIKGNKRFCDVEVYLALQALIQQGFCNSADKAAACFDVFKIIMTTPGETLTTGRVYNTLKDYQPMNYYAGELIKAIQVCLFNEKLPVLYWINLVEYSGFYATALELGKEVIRENCETEKDVEKFLRPLYKEAKNDKEFIDSLYKPACNKWLIAMLYYLRKEHPEALEPSNKGGFA